MEERYLLFKAGTNIGGLYPMSKFLYAEVTAEDGYIKFHFDVAENDRDTAKVQNTLNYNFMGIGARKVLVDILEALNGSDSGFLVVAEGNSQENSFNGKYYLPVDLE